MGAVKMEFVLFVSVLEINWMVIRIVSIMHDNIHVQKILNPEKKRET